MKIHAKSKNKGPIFSHWGSVSCRRYRVIGATLALFLTPGLGFGRLHLAGRFHFSSAVGMQIAATRFHTYDHRVMISTRVSF